MRGHIQLALLSLTAGLLWLTSGSAAAQPTSGWAERARWLSLSLEPALVFSDSIGNDARALTEGCRDQKSRALVVLQHIAVTFTDCSATDEDARSMPRGATAVYERGCGTGRERLILAVSMLRAAGLQAYLAAATCAPWTDSDALGMADQLLPTWLVPGGDYVLLEPTTSGAAGFVPPPCPWGQWVPLAPAVAKPKPLPAAAVPLTVSSIALTHKGVVRGPYGEGLTPGLRKLIDAVLPSLELAPEMGWPQQFVLREHWAPGPGCEGSFHLRLQNPGGFLAATLRHHDHGTTLAVDLRLMAPLATRGAQPHLEALVAALRSLRCHPDLVPTAGGMSYHGRTQATASHSLGRVPTLPRR